jgi:hypothetical protein
MVTPPAQPCIMIPALLRHWRRVHPGDLVLLAAAPEAGLLTTSGRSASAAFPTR